MSATSGILARGPWRPEDIEVSWRSEPYAPSAQVIDEADRALAELRNRGSPSHDGLAARLRSYEVSDGKLLLECEPVRWALRLLPGEGAQSLSALCVVRSADGSWLAGRRAAWLATWAHRWALGAAGSVEVDENPAETLVRELREEWSVAPERLSVEALVKLPSAITMLVGMAWLAEGATVTPDAEHDDFAWWPADVAHWPEQADDPLRRTAELLSAPGLMGIVTFRRLEVASFTHSLVYLALLLCAFVFSNPQPETFVLGLAHGVIWIVMSLVCIAAARAHVIPFWLAVTVAVLGGLGPFAGSIGFVVADRRRLATLE